MTSSRNLVSMDWLASHLDDPNVAVIDCRFTLGHQGNGLNQYMESHIPGALYFDLEQDLSAPIGEHGGRHPLPSVDSLASLFSHAGIDENVTVVAYDDQDLAMAAHLWWLLRYLGHEKVVVLDGSFQSWREQGLPVSEEIVKRPARTFVPRVQADMLVNVEDVQNRSENTALLDSRAGERYRGEVEPLDPKAGHIPGALNYFFKENLNEDGKLRPSEQLKERFAPVQDKEVIVYCGSGVTACVNVLALHEAGRTDTKLYAGSWSDWCSYDLPVATGDEKAENK
ncbi:sulfurtransferase [Brevibacillus dissolubilis]|uniref:sulfurtransferase n=1 Tax=Brevibacillus dissolubilis TaxID=1844116 RepID=UPI001116050C|nr:sulfurtransferase [Brevibacillus dissolubilis]